MVSQMVVAIPIHLHVTLRLNTKATAQPFCLWKDTFYPNFGMEDDTQYSEDRSQEYRFYPYLSRSRGEERVMAIVKREKRKVKSEK